MNNSLSTSTNEISMISEAQLLIQQDDQHATPILKCFQSPGRDSGMRWYVSQIEFCQGFRISTGKGYFHFPSFSRKQPCNVLTLIACASCAQLLRTEMNYSRNRWDSILQGPRSGLEAFPGHTFPYPFILVPGNLLLIPLCNGAVDLK